MKKLIVIVGLILIMTTFGRAEFGLGIGGGLLNPGLNKSDVSKSQFDQGWGYEFLIRHGFVQIADSIQVTARWSYRYFKTTIELPNVLEIWFKFNYLTLDIFVDLLESDTFGLYSGLGGSLVSVGAEKDFLKVTETAFVPEVVLGGELFLSQYYHLFTECSFQFGSIKTGDDQIPLTGFRIVLGATMFLVTE